ncbi:hypothetical protein [Paenibacillus donghaensis]|nr:hypothetical protein [Paenibacillus donghaensis]
MKIRIIGGCGSGKSYAARQLSEQYGIRHYETDNFVWDRSEDNLRYSHEIRDVQLMAVVESPEAWIIEGVHYKWGQASFEQADYIFVLRTRRWLRDYRVVRRFVRTRLGREQWNYTQTLHNVMQMIMEYNQRFDQVDFPRIMEQTEHLAHKRIVVTHNRQILSYLAQAQQPVENNYNRL